MQTEIGSYDAKSKLSEILRRVESGEAFTITNRGKPIADLGPSRINDRVKAEVAIKNILLAQERSLSDKDLAALKNSRRK